MTKKATAASRDLTGPSGDVVFPVEGVFDVALTVTNAAGQSDPTPPSVMVTVKKKALPPDGAILSPTGAVEIQEGDALTFKAVEQPDVTYAWTVTKRP